MTPDEVTALVGNPHTTGGAGGMAMIYFLEDGSRISLWYGNDLSHPALEVVSYFDKNGSNTIILPVK